MNYLETGHWRREFSDLHFIPILLITATYKERIRQEIEIRSEVKNKRKHVSDILGLPDDTIKIYSKQDFRSRAYLKQTVALI